MNRGLIKHPTLGRKISVGLICGLLAIVFAPGLAAENNHISLVPEIFAQSSEDASTTSASQDLLPIITLSPSHIQIEATLDPYVDEGVSAVDMGGIDLTDSIRSSFEDDPSTVDPSTIGTYTIDYFVEDSLGNTATATRTITVVDTVMPILVLVGPPIISVPFGAMYNDQGAIATDLNQDISANIVMSINDGSDVIFPPSFESLDIYTITYSITDSANNGPVSESRIIISCNEFFCPNFDDGDHDFYLSSGESEWHDDMFSPNIILYNYCDQSMDGVLRIVPTVKNNYTPSILAFNNEFTSLQKNTSLVSPTQYINGDINDYNNHVFDGTFPNGVNSFWLRFFVDDDYLRGFSYLVNLPDQCAGYIVPTSISNLDISVKDQILLINPYMMATAGASS